VSGRRGTDFAYFDTRELTVSFDASLDAKEQVRQAVDIVDLVGKYVQLRRQGRGYVAICPWHDDSRPSLQINPERQSFKCWVCDIGGDVFSFVMKMEGVTFPEALAMLAERAGIAIRPSHGGQHGPRSAGVAAGANSSGTAQVSSGDRKPALYRAMAWAEAQYHQCLLSSPEAEPAREYLRKRQLTPESIAKFHLGCSPPAWDWILRQAKDASISTQILETIGILARSQTNEKLYDRFRGRVLFSIRDPLNRPVGLGGRVLPESGSTSPAKYINSPETPLFAKSSLLYGLDVARDAMRKSRTALVMEGYMDCIVAHQYGFANAVAILGTALNEHHIRNLKHFVDKIVLVLDGDAAGKRRTNEVLELFVAREADLRILTLPEEMDPAEFLEAYGAEALTDLLSTRAVDALDHAFQTATEGLDVERDLDAVHRAVERLLAVIARAPGAGDGSSTERQNREWMVLHKLAQKSHLPEEKIRARLTELRRSDRRKRSPVPATAVPGPEREADPGGPIDPFQRVLLEILVGHPECVAVVRDEILPEQLAHRGCRAIYAACCRLADEGIPPTFERLMLEFDDQALKSLLVELDETERAKGTTHPEAWLEDLIRRSRQTDKRLALDSGAIRQTEDESQQDALLEQLVRQHAAKHGISNPTEG
jgi:DNA primase